MERNRDAWMLRMRRMDSCRCRQPRPSNFKHSKVQVRFRSNPSGRGLWEIVNTLLKHLDRVVHVGVDAQLARNLQRLLDDVLGR